MAPQALVTTGPRGFFEAIRKLVNALDQDGYGPFYFAVVARFESRPSDEWVLLLGSRPLARDIGKGMNVVSEKVAELDSAYSRMIKRIGILRENDPYFLSFARFLGVEPLGLVDIRNVTFNGVDIEEGAVFASERNVNKLYGNP